METESTAVKASKNETFCKYYVIMHEAAPPLETNLFNNKTKHQSLNIALKLQMDQLQRELDSFKLENE